VGTTKFLGYVQRSGELWWFSAASGHIIG